MRLLLKWLRPEVVPSPKRKNIPFGTQVQLYLYRRCIKRLAKWYSQYAFSDSVILVGTPAARVTHEYRDYSFEAEIKRMHIQMPNGMEDCAGVTSHFPNKRKGRHFFSCFHFEDHFLLEIDGKKVSIDHGQGRSFVSTFKGKLKESNNCNLFAKYSFSGSMRGNKVGMSSRAYSLSGPYSGGETSEENSSNRTASNTRSAGSFTTIKRAGGLFGDDPLLGRETDVPEIQISTPLPIIKSVEGVTIDESF